MNLKRLRTLIYDLVYIFLSLGVFFMVVVLNGVFIANIANSLRMTGYLDAFFGVQVIMILLCLVWIPLAVIIKHCRD